MRCPAGVNDMAFKIEARDPDAVRENVAKHFPGVAPIARHQFVMASDLVDLVASNCKMTTIRYDKAGVEYPARPMLPLFAIDREKDRGSAVLRGELRIRQVAYKCVSQLDDEDARNDGFSSRDELLSALRRFYGSLGEGDLVCIYSFEFVAPAQNSCHTWNPKSNERLSAA